MFSTVEATRSERVELREERTPLEDGRGDPRVLRAPEETRDDERPPLRPRPDDFFERYRSLPRFPEAPRESRDFPEWRELFRDEPAEREESFRSRAVLLRMR